MHFNLLIIDITAFNKLPYLIGKQAKCHSTLQIQAGKASMKITSILTNIMISVN